VYESRVSQIVGILKANIQICRTILNRNLKVYAFIKNVIATVLCVRFYKKWIKLQIYISTYVIMMSYISYGNVWVYHLINSFLILGL
jgi:hypothetical protein